LNFNLTENQVRGKYFGLNFRIPPAFESCN